MKLKDIVRDKDWSAILVDLKENMNDSYPLSALDIDEKDLEEEMEFIREVYACGGYQEESKIKIYKVKNREIYFSI